jgi:hypothetical protein
VARLGAREIRADRRGVPRRGVPRLRRCRAHLHHRGLAIDGSFTVSGPLETFANAGGVHVARALLAEFSTNLAKLVAERQPVAEAPPAVATTETSTVPPPPAPAPAPPPAAAELSAGKLMWRAFLSWLKSLTGK